MQKRNPDVVVLSDIHLGTYGCHARELVHYLKSVTPQLLILNGDIIDGWQFSKSYFPPAHMQVIKEILNLLAQGTRVVYVTGNHDEMLRRYSELQLGNFQLTDKLVIEMNGKRTWVFHGDVFDATTKGSAKIIAKLGGWGYDWLILLNRLINWMLTQMGQPKMSLSKKVKNGVKKAVSWIADFEQTAAELAINKGYDYVICGHIHQPQQRVVTTAEGQVTYLNSGDWIENLTALEYSNQTWEIYHYKEEDYQLAPVVSMQKQLPELNVETDEIGLHIHQLPF
ncbi:MAG: UDP-2,3-diacylglucosamine diphosphatase [Bacteroidetes bacterium]|jgi:UDP-2,3-diacylglucosamine pyrophosphatase LpxH|nr:UDP-2,3-diacylglucosamine diphosphatase [Bacteroidota bacterium]